MLSSIRYYKYSIYSKRYLSQNDTGGLDFLSKVSVLPINIISVQLQYTELFDILQWNLQNVFKIQLKLWQETT